MKIDIRLAKENDLGELSEVYAETFNKSDVDEHWTKEAAYNLLSYFLKRQPDLAFIAAANSRIVGGFFAEIKPWLDGNHLYEGELFVHPDYQKLGIGKALSKKMFEVSIKKYNASVWDAVTFRNKEFPISWYKKLGFKEIDELVMVSGGLKPALKTLKQI